ncbi:hypothetical protein T12_12700 [Trichinella patagoniensis]|uniref:Uncharacterized protein n=1 Tax=Trichinella patagoniensis TaxID=990121 RepID=A0A0V0ZYL9_9BILA|nr:hypothetical protein T12_12700 [Trichinella patagoniensis]
MHCLTYGRKFIFGNMYKSSTLKILENVQLNIRYSVQRKKREVLCDVARKVTFPSGRGVKFSQEEEEEKKFTTVATIPHNREDKASLGHSSAVFSLSTNDDITIDKTSPIFVFWHGNSFSFFALSILRCPTPVVSGQSVSRSVSWWSAAVDRPVDRENGSVRVAARWTLHNAELRLTGGVQLRAAIYVVVDVDQPTD